MSPQKSKNPAPPLSAPHPFSSVHSDTSLSLSIPSLPCFCHCPCCLWMTLGAGCAPEPILSPWNWAAWGAGSAGDGSSRRVPSPLAYSWTDREHPEEPGKEWKTIVIIQSFWSKKAHSTYVTIVSELTQEELNLEPPEIKELLQLELKSQGSIAGASIAHILLGTHTLTARLH